MLKIWYIIYLSFFFIQFIIHPIAMHFAKKIKHSLLFNFIQNSTTSQGFNEMILMASSSQNYHRGNFHNQGFFLHVWHVIHEGPRQKIFVEMGALTWRAWVVAVRFRELGRWLVLACVLMVHQRLSPLLMSQLVRWYHTHTHIIYIKSTLLLTVNIEFDVRHSSEIPLSL